MDLATLKVRLHDFVKEYFDGADVRWTGQKAAKQTLPIVTLKITSISRSAFPVEEFDDGSPVNCFLSRAMLEVQLFTKGAAPVVGAALSNTDNTAVNDLVDFVNFMTSYYAIDRMFDMNITITPEGATRDVSALLNDVKNEFRAMQEFVVDFVQEAREATGISAEPGEKWKQTSSGGGTKKLSDEKTGWGNDVELISEKEE